MIALLPFFPLMSHLSMTQNSYRSYSLHQKSARWAIVLARWRFFLARVVRCVAFHLATGVLRSGVLCSSNVHTPMGDRGVVVGEVDVLCLMAP